MAILIGASLLFLAGFSRDEALAELGALWPSASAAPAPPREDREPCEIEPPLPMKQRFDRAELDVPGSVTADDEADALRARFGEAEVALRDCDAWKAWRLGEEIDQRRSLFSTRFGIRLEATAAGAAMTDDAARLLGSIERGDLDAGDPAQDSYAALFRVLLLDLAGRGDEATGALAAVRARSWCGNCYIERDHIIQERRSEAAERRGDSAAALAFLDLARRSSFGFPEWPRAMTDTRHGLLMLEADSDWFGTCLLQRVVDLFPGTPGADVSRAALQQVGAFREPEPERIRRLYIEGREERDPLRMLAQEALAGR
jgi:hypothetical protein